MKTIYLVRGLPGAGKTTLAKRITTRVISADDFMIDTIGRYDFKPSRLASCHAACARQVASWIEESDEDIAVANTFTQRWEMNVYYDIAFRTDPWRIIEIALTGEPFESIHGVPAETIEAMKNRFETFKK